MIKFLAQLEKYHHNNLYRHKKILTSAQGINIQTRDKNLINFSSNNYLSLANHPSVKEALTTGVARYGVGSGGSHLISGNFEAHEQLEQALAEHCGQKKSLLFSAGYLANLGVFSALKGEISWVLQDRLNHASLIDANALIGLRTNRYAHNDMTSFKKKLGQLDKKHPNQTGLVASDVVFSMDGDSANIEQLARQTSELGHYLLLDGAHSFAMQPPPFVRGSTSYTNNTIYMATLGKAIGTMGAFVTGDESFIDYLTQKARPFIYTTALPPALCMASLASLAIIKTGKQQGKLTRNIAYFKQLAQVFGLNFLPSQTAIQPLMIGSNANTINLQKNLENNGLLVGAIREPTVPKNTARLRISLNADHTQSQIEQLLTHLKNELMA